MFNNYLDFFTGSALLEAVLKTNYVPGQLGGLFESRALPGTKLALEEQPANGGAALVTATPRGTPSKGSALARRKARTFDTAHYRVDGAAYADEVLNMRATGAAAIGELITARRDETLAMPRRGIDLTLEKLRMAALLTPDNAFGSKPAGVVVAVQTGGEKVKGQVFAKIVTALETCLGGTPYTGVKVPCSDGWWEGLLGNGEIRKAWLYTQQAQQLTGGTLDSMGYAGLTFERYRGAGATAITANKAVAIPTGVNGMFIQGFAPADTLSSVGAGALGTPYYPAAYPIDSGDPGWHIEIQTNPVMVCTRPAAVVTVAMA